MDKWRLIESIKWFLEELNSNVNSDWYKLDENVLKKVGYDLNVSYCKKKFSEIKVKRSLTFLAPRLMGLEGGA